MIIPYGRQKIFNRDKKVILNALSGNLISSGPYVELFERSINNKLGSKYASVCSSGTAAIHLALSAIDTKKGDVFILPIINFVCASNILEQIGAKIFYADVDPKTGQITPASLEDCIKSNRIKKLKAFFTMYLGGDPKNVDKFYYLKKKYNCIFIEDACHALGSKYFFNNKVYNVGNGKHADISTFSLHPLKSITSGEGGLVTTNNKKFKKNLDAFRSHGIIRSKNHWLYDVFKPGLNYRLSDINCSVALSQLKNLNKIINKRKKISNFYFKLFKNNQNIEVDKPANNSSFHLLIARLVKRNNKYHFFKYMLKNKIYVQQHYIPIYEFKFYKKKIKKKLFPGAKIYFSQSFSLPIFYDLKVAQIRFIKKIIMKYFD